MRLLRRRKSLRLKTTLMGLCEGGIARTLEADSFSDFRREVQPPSRVAGNARLARRRRFAPVLAKRYGSAAFLLGSTLSDIFREIEDELRRENLQRLWSRFGKYIIGLAVLAVVATAGVMGWQNYQQRQRQAQGVHYVAALALAREGKDAEAGAAFAELAKNANGGLAALAQLDSGAAKAQAGDVAGAIAVYDQLAANGSADPIFRDIATLLAARYG